MADISPELAEKIRELSARHEENPGRFFVPLANALRDAGEIGQAEELLRSGLKRHPGYLSAHIVLGRCLADRGAQEEAAVEFRHVLSVDPQNLIALRTMGEMTAAAGRTDEAARWYRDLLAVDPMNKEARDALDAVEASAGAAPAAPEQAGYGDLGADFGLIDVDSGAAPSHAPEPEAAEFGMVDPGAFAIGDASPADSAPAPEFGVVELDSGPFAGAASEPAANPDAFGAVSFGDDIPGDALSFGEPEPAAEPPSDLTEPVAEAPASPESSEPAAPPVDFGSWGEVAMDAEPVPAEPRATERIAEYDDFSFGGVELGAPAGEAAGRRPDPMADALELPAGPALDLGGFGEMGHDDDEEVVTETMAELYARQGFHARAIDVYRELIRRRGDEPALVRRVAELETLAGREAAQGAESAVIETPPVAMDDLYAAADDLPVIETGLPGLNFSDGLPFEPVADDATLPFGAEVPPLEGLTFETPGTTGPLEDAAVSDAPPAGLQPFDDFATDPAAFAAEPSLPVFDVPSFDAPAADAPPAASEAASAAPASSGDAFADSFADGFGDGPSAAADAAPEPVASAAPAAPAAEVPSADVAPAVPALDTPQPTAAELAPNTVSSYLTALLAWRPGQQVASAPAQPAAEAPSAESAAPVASAEPIESAAPSAEDAWTPQAAGTSDAPAQADEPAVEDLPWMSSGSDAPAPTAEGTAAPAEDALPEVPSFPAPADEP
ncbi:MAG TPA: hypothetical protein VFH27_04210, partial [Longimicrobiaceae bacterium]|nr:hypothetical protein [Longimicrobiaceae bacterium]